MTASVQPILVTGRLPRLRAALGELGAEAMVVSNLSNLRYLTGFSGSAGVLLVANGGAVNGEAVLVTDGRYRIQAAEQLEASGVADVVALQVGRNEEQREIMQGVLARWRPARLALEAESISWAGQRRWAQLAPEVELVPSSGLVEKLRQVKDDAELDHMARAAAVADDALAEVLPMVSEGRTEAEVALALDSAMRRLGAEESAFETIVASGPNAAKPHARPSERRLERGDPVVIDFGALYEGYRSDMTRTFFVGAPPTGVMAEVLEVVARAQEAGLAAVRAGAVSGEVDQAARRVVTESGYGQAFEHGTGHGVGLDIHEAPWVGAGTAAILQAGTVVTVEPGVYLSGIGGVRIEDTVVVTDTGCRPLTRFPKDPVC